MPFARNAVDGVRIYWEDEGGPRVPVLVLGGFLDPIELVRQAPVARVLSGLPQEFRMVFADHRGHGRSDKPHDPDSYTMSVRVGDVVAVLDALGLERAHVIGISWGGRLGFGLGGSVPERLRSLVTIGQQPYAIDPDGQLTRVVGSALEGAKERGIEPLVEAFEAIVGRYPDPIRRLYLKADAEAMLAAWQAAMSEGDIGGNLSAWSTRTLICVAADDADFFDQAQRAAEEIPNSEFAVVPATDHLGMDTADVDPLLPAVLRTLREGT